MVSDEPLRPLHVEAFVEMNYVNFHRYANFGVKRFGMLTVTNMANVRDVDVTNLT
jgi:hypothetical protein